MLHYSHKPLQKSLKCYFKYLLLIDTICDNCKNFIKLQISNSLRSYFKNCNFFSMKFSLKYGHKSDYNLK